MSQRPTTDQLVTLYHEKGHDALIWYAWRNALRALPILGVYSFKGIWVEETVRQAYSVCRISLLLGQWPEYQKSIEIPELATADDATIYAVIHAMKAVAKITGDADFAAQKIEDSRLAAFVKNYNESITPDVTEGERAESIVAGASSAADDAEYAARDSLAITAAGIVSVAVDKVVFANTIYKDAGNATDYAAAYDFKLLKETQVFDGLFWINQELWPSGVTNGKSCKPGGFSQACEIFKQSLTDIGLDFLAEDIDYLWNNKRLKSHAPNYQNEYSKVELNNTNTLRSLILGQQEADRIHAVRLLLLGPGGAGKTSLSDRLKRRPIEKVKRMTIGVDYLQHQPLNLQTNFPDYEFDTKKLDLFLWDFGGQTIFHGLHRAFLHENCVYVLVVDSRHEQAPDEWLNQIKHLAGQNAKVLLVTNLYEDCISHQNQARLLREFPDLLTSDSFFYFSCLDCVNNKDPDFQKFLSKLVETSLDSQKMVLKETLDVQEALKRLYESKDDVFLETEDLEDVIERITAKSDVSVEMTDKLEQLGFLVRIDHNQASYCLKPEWIIDHAYELLYSQILRSSNGVLAFQSLRDCFEKKLRSRYLEYLINFLQERSLCHKLSTDVYFFPDSANADEPTWASKGLRDKKALIIRFDMTYLPLGFHARLVHALFVNDSDVGIVNPNDIWRQGFIMRKGASQAIVQYLFRKNVIEVALLGSLQDYSELLKTFFVHLKASVVNNNGALQQQIYPSVMLNQQSFSVHSAEKLIGVMQQIENYDELFKEVTKMAGKKINITMGDVGDGSQITVDSKNITQKSHSDNRSLVVNDSEHQIISTIVTELLKDVSTLSSEQLGSIVQVKSALENETPENKKLLGRVWSGLSEVTDFTNNMISIGQTVSQNQTSIIAALVTATEYLNTAGIAF